MPINSQLVSLQKSINNTPVPFVPLVVVGLIISSYANSFTYLSFSLKVFDVNYLYHILLSISMISMLYVYYKYTEILTEFENVEKNTELSSDYSQILSTNELREIVKKLESFYYVTLPLRYLLIVIYFILWLSLKDSFLLFNLNFYETQKFLPVMLMVIEIIVFVFVMEFPIWASYYYYKDVLGYKKQTKKEEMIF